MNIGIIGAFGFEDIKKYCGGQPVKTRELYYLLENELGKDSISFADTYKWKKNPITFFFKTIKLIKKSDIVIILPAQNGLSVLSSLCVKFKRKNTKIFYDVIGGWLPDYLKTNKKVLNNLKKCNGIWVETETMQMLLKSLGVNNVRVIPNFKKLNAKKNNTIYPIENVDFCFFSRVIKEKGIEDAIVATKRINDSLPEKTIHLDIYGPITDEYKNFLLSMIESYNMKNIVNYKGIISPSKSVETIEKYYGMLFPTYYEGEGLPGTLIDSMFSGVPVIASDWKYNSEVVIENYNGLLFKPHDIDDLYDKMLYLVDNYDIHNKMCKNCIEISKKYSYDTAKISILEELTM